MATRIWSRVPSILGRASSVTASARVMPVLARAHGGIASHTHAENNTAEQHFDFNDENTQLLHQLLAKFPRNAQGKQAACLPALDMAQKQCGGWLPLAAMNKVAKLLEMPPMKVYEVASFYSMYNRTPVGKFLVQMCTTTPCMLRDGYKVLEAMEKHLGIASGQTTPDNLFTLKEVECLGACVNAPMMQIQVHGGRDGDFFFEDLSPEDAVNVLIDLREGRAPTRNLRATSSKGSWANGVPLGGGVGMYANAQYPRGTHFGCEGPMGQTSLKTDPPGPRSRDLKAIKAELDAAAKAAADKAAADKK